ncbi:hypothetical protein OH492_11955 [Vibrio chagasii]|nr:hypothetical protein [Vibrio chagasii]
MSIFGPEPVHVDFKFVSLPWMQQFELITTRLVLWERDSLLTDVFSSAEPHCLTTQWLKDRFGFGRTMRRLGPRSWRILQKRLSFSLSFRQNVLSPLALNGGATYLVGKIEEHLPGFAQTLVKKLSVDT